LRKRSNEEKAKVATTSKSRKRKKTAKGKEKEVDSGKRERRQKRSPGAKKEKPIPRSVTRAAKAYDLSMLVDFISKCSTSNPRCFSCPGRG
jgi:hypothetical protein